MLQASQHKVDFNTTKKDRTHLVIYLFIQCLHLNATVLYYWRIWAVSGKKGAIQLLVLSDKWSKTQICSFT